MSLATALPRIWQTRGLWVWLLLPLAGLFRLMSALRRALYRRGALVSHRLPVPVIVVGNITVGGSGKTPLTLWLATRLVEQGWSPAILSRGHGGRVSQAGQCRGVSPGDLASEVGDEPLLMARRGICPVWIGRDRVAAAQSLLAGHPEVNVLIADDGLQHYRLQRDVEIVVMDGRGVGNGLPLPAGPMREPLARAWQADALVFNECGEEAPVAFPQELPGFFMALRGSSFFSLHNHSRVLEAEAFKGDTVHAMAGIGNPGRFFAHLERLGIQVVPHAFPDHHPFQPSDLDFPGAEAILMTEKDGVKCAAFAPDNAWVLRVEGELDATLVQLILEKLNGRPPA